MSKARLYEQYENEMVPALTKQFGYKNIMEVPKLSKIVVNMGVGEAKENVKLLDAAIADMEKITGQHAVITKAKKSVANFKLREGMPIGCKVTLRGNRMYEFADRLIIIALPRVRDFRGVSANAFDGRGNYSLGIREPLIFPDFDQLVEAIDPSKFYLVSDTNGWLLDRERARHLKSIGVDKIQLSLDSLDAAEHDAFRHAPGAHARALRAIDAALEAGLNIILSTVVTHDRIRSEEFVRYLEFAKSKGVGTFVTYAKPVGAWEGKFDNLVTKDDMDYMRTVLEKKYNVFTHLTPSYGLDLGCIAVKRMISITKYGDVMPCPYMQTSIGNFFEEPLADIIKRGMNIKWFGKHVNTCLVAESRPWIEKYLVPTYGKPLPVKAEEIYGPDDLISK